MSSQVRPSKPRKKAKDRPAQSPAAIPEMPAISRAHKLLSVVIPARNEGDFLRRTVEQLLVTLPENSEVIVVDNGSTDGSVHPLFADRDRRLRIVCKPPLGAPQARNTGANLAQGEILVFADGHVDVGSEWWQPMVDALADPTVGAVGTTITTMGQPKQKGYGYRISGPDLRIEWLGFPGMENVEVPFLGGCFVALRKELFTRISGFDAGIWVWGSEDTELCLRLWLLGYRQLLIPAVEVAHHFRNLHPYPVNWLQTEYNKLRLSIAHFSQPRLQQVIEHSKQEIVFAEVMARLADSDIWQRRQELASQRKYDDDWFFKRFKLSLE